MIEPRLILCSGMTVPANDPLRVGRRVIELDSLGATSNVNIQLEDVARVFMKDLSPRLVDLLEIAAYVYTADCATRRGKDWYDDHTTEAWGRNFYFIIPVREPTFWNRSDVQRLLIQILQFLSDDDYEFEFRQLKQDRPVQSYLDFRDDENWPFYGVDRVLMFSGGLDSLAGAVETAANGGNLVLVSHRPVSTLSARQRQLFEELRKQYPSRVIHIPVWINKDEHFGREHTQRTRSFLFSALGIVVAESVRAGGVRFFENGVVSLNLPISDEVLGARASRTTHPITLELYTQFYRILTYREVIIDNPYLFKTKTEVVTIIAERGKSHLIRYTCSCAHTGRFHSGSQWHCGTCSQCIDRRIAILMAGQEESDSETDYVSDVFTGSRKDGEQKNMAVNYIRHAFELRSMSETEIATRFNPHLTRAVRYFPKRQEAAHKFIDMHKRHGEIVYQVLEKQLQRCAKGLLEGTVHESSMLALAIVVSTLCLLRIQITLNP